MQVQTKKRKKDDDFYDDEYFKPETVNVPEPIQYIDRHGPITAGITDKTKTDPHKNVTAYEPNMPSWVPIFLFAIVTHLLAYGIGFSKN